MVYTNINEFYRKYNLIENETIKKLDKDIILKILNSNVITDFIPGYEIIYAIYYRYIKNDINEMKKYYLIAVENNNIDAIIDLGYYYYEVEKNYVEMFKYYLMGIELGNSYAMCNLGIYYTDIKDYKLATKYYLMAIEKGNECAMNNLGYYYYINKEYDLAIKYYLMAIENGCIMSICNLGCLYLDIKEYEKMKHYYLLAISKGNKNALTHLFTYYNKHIYETHKLLLDNKDKYNLEYYNFYGKYFNYKEIKELFNTNEIFEIIDKGECSICYEEKELLETKCGHIICNECLIQLENANCPYCRKNMFTS
jgi:TPR repeat protein